LFSALGQLQCTFLPFTRELDRLHKLVDLLVDDWRWPVSACGLTRYPAVSAGFLVVPDAAAVWERLGMLKQLERARALEEMARGR